MNMSRRETMQLSRDGACSFVFHGHPDFQRRGPAAAAPQPDSLVIRGCARYLPCP